MYNNHKQTHERKGEKQMNSLKFRPEGWNEEITPLDKNKIHWYQETNEVFQGVVNDCDSNYNLYISLENGLTAIMPRKEVEGININEDGLPKTNLCTGKVHKFVQFKIKEAKDENHIIVSRKEVQQEALNWVKNQLEEGTRLTRYCKKY